MSLTRRGLFAAAGAAAAATALTACGGKTDPAPVASGEASAEATAAALDPIKVKVGYINDGNGCMLQAVAQELDLWKKYALEVENSVFTNGPLQIQAMGTGDIEFGYIGMGASWLPMRGDAKIVAVNSLGEADRVVAQPGIKTMEDLRGKKVGVPEGSSGDTLLNVALSEAGMTTDDIERLVMDMPTIVTAFASGQIDAAGTWYPNVVEMRKNVPDMVEIAKSSDYPQLAFPAALVAAPNITEKPELLKRYQQVQKEAFEWAASNTDKLPALLADFLQAPEESIAEELKYVNILRPSEMKKLYDDGTVFTWYNGLNERFIQSQKIDKMADPKEYILYKEYLEA